MEDTASEFLDSSPTALAFPASREPGYDSFPYAPSHWEALLRSSMTVASLALRWCDTGLYDSLSTTSPEVSDRNFTPKSKKRQGSLDLDWINRPKLDTIGGAAYGHI